MDSSSETVPETNDRTDKRLVSYFETVDETGSQQQLEYLLNDVAKPIIKRILQHSESLLGSSGTYSVEDGISEVLLKVLSQLRLLKADPHQQNISNFDGLVATITYRSIADYLRAKNRRRSNLERKIKRLFAANTELEIWKDSHQESICGFTPKRDQASFTASETYPTYEEVSTTLTESHSHSLRNTAELILLILSKLQRPVRFRDLVEAIGQTSLTRTGITEVETLTARPDESLTTDENRRLLKRLFLEIQKLTVEQRKSLLLNMADSYGYSIEWFVFAGVASEEQLAGLLNVSLDEFRGLLDRLPISDREIANQIGVSPTKVANIRKAVRDRLARCRAVFLKEERR